MMNKNRKSNTSRPANNGPGQGNNNSRSSPRSRPQTAEGVYNNSHFLHAAASQMGNPVRVQTKGGVVVEGIFRTFSDSFSIALEVPHRYQNGGDDKKINVDTVQDNLIIKLCDIVTMHAKDVDLDYAVRDTFQTDTAISSRMNGTLRNTERKLQPWSDGADGLNGDMSMSLELDSQTNGWDANEMFQLNEKEHGIKTTFKDNLENYTVQIEKKDTMDFRKQELEAERIANEIENNPVTKDRLDVENGDEEAAFAAVSRQGDEQNNTTNSNTINSNTDKMTPPPASATASTQQKFVPQQQKRNQERKMMPTNNKPMYTKPPMQSSGPNGGMATAGPIVQQTLNAGGFKMMTINPAPPQYGHQPQISHYGSQQQQNQQQQMHNQQGLNSNNDGGKMNGNDGRDVGRENNTNKPMPPRNIRTMNPGINPQIPVSFNEPPPPLNQVPNQHMGKPPTLNIHMPPQGPPPHLQNVPDGPQTIHMVAQQPVVLTPNAVVVTHAPPPAIHMHAGQQPRPQREPMMRNRNDEIRTLRTFHSDFTLGTAAPPGQQQNVPPQVPNQQQVQSRPEMQDNGQNPMSHPPPTQNIEMGKAQHAGAGNNANSHHHIQHHPTPSSTPHADKSHGPSSTPPQASTPQSVNNVNISINSISSGGVGNSNSADSTPTSASSSSNDKPSSAAGKKFTLNPQAKPFTPRSPSTPTQSRPHTPQTPGPMVQQQQQQQQQIPPPQQQVAYAPAGAPLVFYCVQSNQRPTNPQMAVRSNKFQHYQVTQATGQPIFNPPAPHPAVMQAFHPHAQQMQTVPSQTYPSTAIRMYQHEGQQQPHITQYLVPTPPSTTPSPGQHQQAFHPGPQPSPAAGPPAQAFQPQGQYVMFMPQYGPPFVNSNQHNQQLQVVMPQQQQHPTQ